MFDSLPIEFWMTLGTIFGTLIIFLFGAAVTALAGRFAFIQVRGVWSALKYLVTGQDKYIRSKIDQPSDYLPQLIQRYTGIPALAVQVFLLSLYKALLAKLQAQIPEAKSEYKDILESVQAKMAEQVPAE